MLHLVHRVKYKTTTHKTIEQAGFAASESLSHIFEESSLDPIPSSIRTRNAQEINITNCDVTTWSWVNLVHPLYIKTGLAPDKRSVSVLSENPVTLEV